MDKIETFANQLSFLKSPKKKKEEKVKPGQSKFSKTVQAVFRSQTDRYTDGDEANAHTLEELLDEVCATGEKLKDSPTFENIKAYKKRVKNFLQYIVAHMLDVEEHVSGANVLKRKRFTVINIIDAKLESLTMEIIQNQNQQLNILSRIDEINGLLVDLMG